MSYIALARKWRPRDFGQLAGQEHVVRALTHALDSDRVHHALLFTGTRGVGKTTIARILAKSLNCLTAGVSSKPCGQCAACREIDEGRFVDLIEVDAASRTKVDDTRDLLDNVQYAPASGRYKVYLIDEVHMLSNHSFNALLKTLEEPPPHVKFLLATTDPQKLPVTVLSRCLQFNLKRLPAGLIKGRFEYILKEEGIVSEPAALELLARAAAGSMRDGLSLLDQLIAFGGGRVTEVDARDMLGAIDRAYVVRLVEAIAARDAAGMLQEVAALEETAPDYAAALDELALLFQKVALRQAVPDYDAGELFPAEAVAALAARLSAEDLQLYYQIALLGRRDLALAADERSGFEMILLRMLSFEPLYAEQSATPATPARATTARSASLPQSRSASAGTPPQSRAAQPVAPPSPSGAAPTRAPAAAATGQPPPPSAAAGLTPASEPPPTHPALRDWADMLAAMNIQGFARQLAANCSLSSREGHFVALTLDARGAHYRTPQNEAILREALSALLGAKVTLRIEIGEPPAATPARQRAKATDERNQALRESVQQDPTVQALQQQFGATVITDSIKPVM